MADSSDWLYISDFRYIVQIPKIVHGKLDFIPIPFFQLERGFFFALWLEVNPTDFHDFSLRSLWYHTQKVIWYHWLRYIQPLHPQPLPQKSTKNYSPNDACWFSPKGAQHDLPSCGRSKEKNLTTTTVDMPQSYGIFCSTVGINMPLHGPV